MALVLIARLILAAVFVVAGLAKLRDSAGAHAGVVAFGVPRRIAGPVALVLPIVELVVAGLLLPATTATHGSAAALALLAVFTAAIAWNLARGRAPDCHCFGGLHPKPAGPRTLLRNATLLAVAALALTGSLVRSDASAIAWLGRLDAAALTAVISVAVAASAIGLGTVAFLHLMRSYGTVLVRLDRLETALAEAGIQVESVEQAERVGLEPGSEAPWFLAPDVTGAGVSRDDLLAHRRPLLLVFTNPHCGPCAALLPRLAEWQQELQQELTVACVSSGAPEAVRAEVDEFELTHVLVDEQAGIAERFGVTGTPGAVLIEPDGTIAGWAASGAEAIEALVEIARSPRPAPALTVGSSVPAREVRTLEGELITLDDLRGREAVLLFWNPDCGFCRSLREELVPWDTGDDDALPRLVVVSSGDPAATRAEAFRSTVLLDERFEVGEVFGAAGTPMAVLLDADARVASETVAGGEAVLALAHHRLGRV